MKSIINNTSMSIKHNRRTSSRASMNSTSTLYSNHNEVIQNILNELDELLHDEEIDVQCAALTTIIEILDLIPPLIKSTRAIPLIKSYCIPYSNTLSIL